MKSTKYFDLQRFASWQAVVCLGTLLVLASACRDDERLLGLEAQPDGELVPIETIDTFTVRAFTVKPGELRTDEVTNFVGQTYSDVFGVSRSSINLNFQLQEGQAVYPGDFIYNIDSVVLHMRPDTGYGSFPLAVPLNVYRLRNPIERDDSYFNNSVAFIDPSPVAKTVVDLADNFRRDSTLLDVGDTSFYQSFRHRIYLDNDIGENLIYGFGREYQNDDDFATYFPGLQVTVDSSSSSANLGMLSYALATGESGIWVYANIGDTARRTFFFPATGNSTRFNTFQHNYAGTPAEVALNDPTNDDSLLYVQGLAGLRTEIQIPSLNGFVETTDAVMSKATLNFKVADEQPSNYDPAVRLFLVAIDTVSEGAAEGTEGDDLFTFDYIYSTERYGGIYNASNNEYEFDVTRQIQAIMEQSQDNNMDINQGFRLIREIYGITNSSNVAEHTVLKGGSNIVLKLHMTNLNP